MSKRVPAVLSLTLAGILAVVLFVGQSSDAILHKNAQAQRKQLCAEIALSVEHVFAQARATVYFISAFPAVTAAVDPGAGRTERELARKQLTNISARAHPDADFDLSFSLLDGRGKSVIVAEDAGLQSLNVAFQEAAQGRRTLYGPDISDKNEAVFILAEPVFNGRQPSGMLAGHLNLRHLSLETMIALRDDTEQAFALDSAGRLLFHSARPELVGISLAEEPWVREILRAKEGEIRYDWSGERRLAAFAPLPKAGWTIVASFREANALGIQRSIGDRMLLAALLPLLLLGAALFLLLKDSLRHLRAGGELALAELEPELRAAAARDGEKAPAGRAALLHAALAAALEKLRNCTKNYDELLARQKNTEHELLHAMPDGCLRLDAGGVVRLANTAALSLLGVTEREAAGSRVENLLLFPPGHGHESLRAVYQACRDENALNPVTGFMRNRDGNLVLAEFGVTPLFAAGAPDGVLLTLRDVGLIADQRAMLAALTQAVGGVYFVWNEHFRLVDCADRCAAFFRVDDEKLFLRDPSRFIPTLQANGRLSSEEMERHQSEALRLGSATFDWNFRDGASESLPCEMELRRITLGGRPGLLGLARDMRRLRGAETKLAAERAKLEQVLDALPVAVGLAHGNKLLYANLALEEFLARYGNESALAPFSPMLSKNPASDPLPEIRGKHLQFVSNDGTLRDFLLSCVPTEYDGSPALFFWIADITQLKVEEQAVVRARDQAVAALQAKEQFLSLLARDLRKPLNSILFTLQQGIQSRVETDRAQALNSAYSYSKRLLDTLGYMLSISGVDALSLHPDIVRFKPKEFFSEALEPFRAEAEMQGISYNWEIDPELPEELAGDPALLRRILTHLVYNAVKYTASGGVEVRVTRLQTQKLNRAAVYILISDTGLGLSDAKLAGLFGKFASAGSPARDGAGLGLAMVTGYVKLMKGELCVMSEQGRGTEMHLMLPFALEVMDEEYLSDGMPPMFYDQSALPGRRNAKGSILVVDDDPTSRQIVVLILQKMGYEAEGAEDGTGALQLLEKKEFDLLFMDILMPGMSGIDVTLKIRNDTTGRYPSHIPIVAMTGNAMLGDPEKFLAAGMNDYLSKPIIIEDMANVLQNILGTM